MNNKLFLLMLPILLIGFSVNAYAVPIDANYLIGENYTNFRLGNSIIDSHQVVNQNGTKIHIITTTLGIPERFSEDVWVWTNSTDPETNQTIPNGHFERNWNKPYFIDETNDIVKVETTQGSFVYDKNACAITFYNGELLNENSTSTIGSDSYLMYGAQINTQNWIELTDINTAQCDTTVVQDGENIEVWGTKTVAGKGSVTFKWIKLKDQDLKVQIEPTNLNPTWNNHKVGIKQTIHVPDTVKLGDTEFYLPDYNGTTVDRTWIQNHKSEIIDLNNNLNYYIGLGWPFLQDIDVVYEDGQSKLVFNYLYGENLILPGETLIIDPTYGYIQSTTYRVDDDSATATTTCDGAWGLSQEWSALSKRVATSHSGASGNNVCWILTSQFDTTPIPDQATITDTVLRYDIDSVNGGKTCDFKPMQNKPSDYTSSDPNQVIGLDILNGTAYVSNDSSCSTVADDYTEDLGSSADTDLQNLLSFDWFAVGISFNDMSRDGTNPHSQFDDFELQVTYTLPEPKPEYSTSYIYDETLGQYNMTLASPDSLYDDYDTMGQTILKDGFYPPYSITTEPILHLTFDDTGDTNPIDIGSRAGTTTQSGDTTYRASPLGHGLYFDGTGDYNTPSDTTDFDFDHTDAWSVSYWISLDPDVANLDTIMAKDDGINNPSSAGWSHIWGSSDYVGFRLHDGTDGFGCTTTTGIVHNDNTWYHIVSTFDGSSNTDGITMYVNAVDESNGCTDDAMSASISTTDTFRIGTQAGSRLLDATLDDIRIYDYELTSAQITDLYNYEYSTKYTYPELSTLIDTSDILAHYTFDNTLHDDSRSGNDAINVGGSSTSFIDADFGRGLSLVPSLDDTMPSQFNLTSDQPLTASTPMNFNYTDAFSIAFWARCAFADSTCYQTNSNEPLIGTATGSNQDGWSLWDWAGDSETAWTFAIGDGTNIMNVGCSSGLDGTDTDWHFHVFSHNGSNTDTGMTCDIDNGTTTTSGNGSIELTDGTGDLLPYINGGTQKISANYYIDNVIIVGHVLNSTEISNLYSMSDYSESNTISIVDDDVSAPFSANYTGISITSLGSSADNTSVYSAPSPDDTTASSVSTTTTDTTITLDVDTMPESYGTAHGAYVEVLNSTDSNYYNVDLYGDNYVPLPDYWWKFDGKETGRINYGIETLENLQFIGNSLNYGEGIIGSGVDFTINDSTYYALTDSAIGKTGGNDSAFTISGWVKPTSSGVERLFDTCDIHSTTIRGIELSVNSVNEPQFVLFDSNVSNYIFIESNSTVGADSWTHIATSYNANATKEGLKMYVNGTEESDFRSSLGTYIEIDDNATDISIGSRCGFDFGAGGENDGLLDNVKFWDSELTASQIASEYAVTSPPIDSNPYEQELLHLKFNNDVYDSAHGYNGQTLTGDGVVTYGLTGKINSGGEFSGDKLTINDFPITLEHDQPYSFSYWLNATTLASNRVIMAQGNDWTLTGGIDAGFYNAISTGAKTIFVRMSDGTSAFGVESATTLASNTMYHITGTYDGTSNSNGTKIYIDSVLDATGSDVVISSTVVDTTTNPLFTIGSESDGHSNYAGMIDDLRWFDFALSQSQIDEIYNSGSGTESPLGVTVDATPSATITGLTEDTTYTFKVYPINGAGQSGESYIYNATTLISPNPPVGLNVVSSDPTPLDIQLIWNESTHFGSNTILTGYDIEVNINNTTWNYLTTVTPITTTSYIDAGRLANTQYAYRINTLGDIVNGTFSSPDNVTTPTTSDAPTGVVALPKAGNTSMQLTWSTPTDDGGSAIIGYKIEKQINGGGWTTLLNNTGTTGVTGVATGLSTGNTYNFRVSAWNNIGIGLTNSTSGVEFTVGTILLNVNSVGQTIIIQPTVNITYGIPDTTVQTITLYRNDVAQTAYIPNQDIAKNANFTFSKFFDYPTPGDYDYYVIAKTNNGESGQTTYIQSPTERLTNQIIGTDQNGLIAYRNESFNLTVIEFIAFPTDYDLLIKVESENKDKTYYGWNNVEVNATVVVPVDPTLKYYITAYIDPTFSFSPGLPTSEPTIPTAYPITATVVSMPDPNQVGFTLGIDVIAGESGIFGLPLVFIFIIALASIFTGRSAPMGIIFIAVALGFMAYMGLVDFNFDPANQSNTATWAIIIVAVIIGVMVGKRWD